MTEFIGYAVRSADDEAGSTALLSWNQVRVHRTLDGADRARRYGLYGRDVWKVKLNLPDGAYFLVEGDQDMSAGQGGHRFVGEYLDYWMAHEAARGQGAQGSWGYISVRVPKTLQKLVIGPDGEFVVLSEQLIYEYSSVAGHVEFLGPATD